MHVDLCDQAEKEKKKGGLYLKATVAYMLSYILINMLHLTKKAAGGRG